MLKHFLGLVIAVVVGVIVADMLRKMIPSL